jgi:hypothetical protein
VTDALPLKEMPLVTVTIPPATHGLSVLVELPLKLTPLTEQPLATGGVSPLSGSATGVVPRFGDGLNVGLPLLSMAPETSILPPPVTVIDGLPLSSIAAELVELT